jgi:hypothetical protein
MSDNGVKWVWPELHRWRESEPEPATFTTAVSLGKDRVVTVANVPQDLTAAEAERICDLIQVLVGDGMEAK